MGKILYLSKNIAAAESSKPVGSILQNKASSTFSTRLPPELLILNRYGIGYPYLAAAWKLSQKYQITAFEVLIKAKIISLETWYDAQHQLALERQKTLTKQKQSALLLDQSINNLNKTLPFYSAKKTFEGWQTGFLLLFMILIALIFFVAHENIVLISLVILTIFYMANIFLRGLLLASFDTKQTPNTDLLIVDDENLPVYSVLVALHKEANQIEQLTKTLWQLDWPKHKLDIKLICEADDSETITAILDAKLPSCFELIRVPAALPRTKPKALNYALPLCRGEYLVLYDAEDMPSSGQLKEAYLKFEYEDDNLACVQAPLRIHNYNQNWLSGMFAIEYITLFNGILPILAKWRVPIPLGGTSNHFKINILKQIGAWDPYNVTEDADLGIRLFREGYLCTTITLPTYEEAPPQLKPWIRQRTRWLKGWMQTILVHSRNPFHFLDDVGFKNAMAFHLLMTSIVISALIHPVFLATSIIQIINLNTPSSTHFDGLIIATSIFNLVGGYTTYALLAYAVLQQTKYDMFSKLLFTLPIYWILISFAGWRAIIHLIVKPHDWEKTPHGLVK